MQELDNGAGTMKIGVLSDTHDEIASTRAALEILRQQGAAFVIHCGDLTSPEVVLLFEGWDAVFVWGNMDKDTLALRDAVRRIGRASIGDTFTAHLGGAHLAACHGDDAAMLKRLIRSGLYDYVFHGHTHERRDERVGRTRVINPGALGGKRQGPRSLCVLDVGSGEAAFIELPEE